MTNEGVDIIDTNTDPQEDIMKHSLRCVFFLRSDSKTSPNPGNAWLYSHVLTFTTMLILLKCFMKSTPVKTLQLPSPTVL